MASRAPCPKPQRRTYGPVSLIDVRRDQCRWITTPGHVPIAELRFCGERIVPGCSWCAEHRARVFKGRDVRLALPRRRGSWPAMPVAPI